MSDSVRTPFSRVWTIEDRANPFTTPLYQGTARALSPSQDFGDRTPIREPDPERYGSFITVDAIKGEKGLPTISLENRYQFSVSDFLDLARRGCPFDAQVHFGKCQDPRDFNLGWDKVLVFEGADVSTYSGGDLGALNQGDDASILETIDVTGLDMYEIKRLAMSSLAGTQVTREVVDIAICDSISCGDCGIPSDGCSRFFAIQLRDTGSPGLPAELISSQNGGATIIESNIDSLPVGQDPSAIQCVGSRLALVSNGDCALHYTTIVDIINGVDVWTRNAAGLTCAAGAPNDLFSLGSTFTWVVGNGGNIYFYADITAAAVVQDAGVATTQNLNAIHGLDTLNLVAVGASNSVVFTRNGGSSWSSVTGPAVGVALNTVWMLDNDVWFVGTAGGRLFFTRNAGTSWTEKSFPGSGTGVVRDIVFATPTVGYLSHDTTAPAGRILRTIDGGASWYVLPEGTGAIPANDRISALAASGDCPNTVYGGGLNDNATDGIIVKGS